MARRCAFALAVLLALGAHAPWRASSVHADANEPLLVIIASATHLTNVSSPVLRRAFEGYPTEYERGKRLIPLNSPAGSAIRSAFDRALLGRTPEEVGRFWVDQRIRAGIEPPRALATAELATRVVASLPGAITYVTPDLVTPRVRVLSVDGKTPGTPGYLFARR